MRVLAKEGKAVCLGALIMRMLQVHHSLRLLQKNRDRRKQIYSHNSSARTFKPCSGPKGQTSIPGQGQRSSSPVMREHEGTIFYTCIFSQFSHRLMQGSWLPAGHGALRHLQPSGSLPDLLALHSTRPVCVQNLWAPGNGRDWVMGKRPSVLNRPLEAFFLSDTWGTSCSCSFLASRHLSRD